MCKIITLDHEASELLKHNIRLNFGEFACGAAIPSLVLNRLSGEYFVKEWRANVYFEDTELFSPKARQSDEIFNKCVEKFKKLGFKEDE